MEAEARFVFCHRCGCEFVVAYRVPQVGVITVSRCPRCLTWHTWGSTQVQVVADKYGAIYVIYLN